MDEIFITKVNPINYVCENLINELSNSIDKRILENLQKNMK